MRAKRTIREAVNPLGEYPGETFDSSLWDLEIMALAMAVAAEFSKVRQEALREAAEQVATNYIVSGSPGPLFDAGWACACEAGADAIRRLMTEPGPETKEG